MRKSRRQIANRIAEAAGLGLLVLDPLVLFLFYLPEGSKLAEVARKHEALRHSIWKQQERVDSLTKFEVALPYADKNLGDFTSSRTPSRREAYSTAAHLVHRVADASTVKISAAAYHLETDPSDPLQHLAIDISLAGSYTNLLQFSYGLETANEFIAVRQCDLTPGDKGALDLRLLADLYLKP